MTTATSTATAHDVDTSVQAEPSSAPPLVRYDTIQAGGQDTCYVLQTPCGTKRLELSFRDCENLFSDIGLWVCEQRRIRDGKPPSLSHSRYAMLTRRAPELPKRPAPPPARERTRSRTVTVPVIIPAQAIRERTRS